MTNTITRTPASQDHRAGALAVLEIANGLADGVHTLIPAATAAVVVSIGSDWQLVAQRGAIDITDSFRADVACQVRDSDLPQQHGEMLVAPFSAVGLHALLIVVAGSKEQMPRRAHALVQPLLDAGGILLDRAIALQERDRAVRRVVRLCQLKDASPVRTIDDLERAVASLWPGATARFHTSGEVDGVSWSARRLVRVACDLDQPSIGRTPAYDGLLPRDLTYQAAIPMASHQGALLLECPASGEEFDTRSLATAIAMTRELELETHHA